jgi:MinD superfamily P-loop ATPase
MNKCRECQGDISGQARSCPKRGAPYPAREICDGCGLCTEVCIFNGMQIVDGKSVIA